MLPILIFSALTLLFAFRKPRLTLSIKFKPEEDCLERFFVSTGLILAFIPILGTVFNLLNIPIDYKYFLLFFAAILLIEGSHYFKKSSIRIDISKITKESISWTNLLLILLFFATLYMYLKGSFAYPWFEDNDPWIFASAAKYIAVNKTFSTNFRFTDVAQPYPQAYQIIMGLINQISPSINWCMKFFNSLFISLSIPFFFYFANKLLKDRWYALLATALIFSMPAWLTHFMFSLNLAMVLLPLFFYALLKAENDRSWQMPAIIIFASIWITHFYSSFIITIMLFIYFVTRSFSQSKIDRLSLKVGGFGLLLSGLVFWLPSIIRFKKSVLIDNTAPGGISIVINIIQGAIKSPHFKLTIGIAIFIIFLLLLIYDIKKNTLKSLFKKSLFKPALFLIFMILVIAFLMIPKKLIPLFGSASMEYGLHHFIILKNIGNFIQNPYGIGIIPIILALIGIFYILANMERLFTDENKNFSTCFVWIIFTFLGVMGASFSVHIVPFRMWSFFAFSTAIFGTFALLKILSRSWLKRHIQILILVILMVSTLPTWYFSKYILNTNEWNEGYLQISESRFLYTWVKNFLPKNSKVYAFYTDQCVPIVFDMVSFPWDKEVSDYSKKDIEKSMEDNYAFLKRKGYEYLVIDGSSILREFNDVNNTLPEDKKQSKFIFNARLLMIKKEMMKKSPKYFKILKEAGDAGTVFKIL